ncbi:Rrf2 family transcriptional regulator [Alicyclobacillus sendaiensis]|uniref:HTH-type transcriptional regulator NsrR n=1 Tax=Alicyclobacillus sendaiensis PA2 TaxID=3029425 RepID=A0ABT6XZ22_ALISE|nr:Rrf2 family transcriptional regulator [Alicyclobacillus sendaiensis]MDI9260333.1 Rrf2 family transcriptional regulator [Alicyclobacillus sendaiensis PA2]
MNLTVFTDYALRVLIYTANQPEGKLVQVDEIARVYGISRNHLTKAVHRLGQVGYLETVRGRGGGMRLAMSPHDIRIGDVVRAMEDDFAVVGCFANGHCVLLPGCKLRRALGEAVDAFLETLNQYTLADIAVSAAAFRAT